MAAREIGNQKTYSREDSGDQTSPSGEDSKEPHNKFRSSQDRGNDERPVHPTRDLLVRVEALLEIIAKHILHGCVLQTPDLDGVEPELCLGRRAVCDLLDAVLLLARAV